MKKVFPVLAIVLGVYWVIAGLYIYDFWVRKGPGGGFMPVVGGGLAVIFGIIILIEDAKDKSPSGFSWKAFIPVGALIALVLSSYILGIMISIAIYIFLWLKFMEKYSTVKSLAIGIICVVILYAIFDAWLKVPLPSGILRLL